MHALVLRFVLHSPVGHFYESNPGGEKKEKKTATATEQDGGLEKNQSDN